MPPLANRERAGAVKLTIQKFYRVAGSSTQKLGVVPDIILPSVRDALEVGEKYADHALDYDKIRRAQDLKPYNRHQIRSRSSGTPHRTPALARAATV